MTAARPVKLAGTGKSESLRVGDPVFRSYGFPWPSLRSRSISSRSPFSAAMLYGSMDIVGVSSLRAKAR